MPAQTRYGMPSLLDDGTITALKEALFGSIREDMERFLQEKSNSQNVDPSGAYDDPLAKIKKLKQTGGLQQYIDAYDRLLCRVELQDEQEMSFSIASLQSEIELVVRMFKPTSLAEFGQVFLLEVVADSEESSGSQEIEECLEEEIVWEKEPRNKML
nr:gypsy/Ty3 retroelement polyprotein [Tanacetum cinerariifolium]